MSEQNPLPQQFEQPQPSAEELAMLPPPPELSQLPPPPVETNETQGRIGAFFSRMNERYNAWLDRTVERNPYMEKQRLNATVAIMGGVAVFASVKFGPEFADHVVSAFQDDRTIADGIAVSLTAGAANAVGMNYLDRRRARKQANS